MTETTTTMAPDPAAEPIEPGSAPAAPVRHAPRRGPVAAVRGLAGGISAVGVKELRGRMRGRRAFTILTIYLVLLAGFAWMYTLILERQFSSGFGGSAAYASAAIGQEVFAGLILLETLLVVLLAPASTAGAISLEREKQTLDLLVTTPISSLAIVIGKLLSALTYVFILIAASIPLTSMVFVFGGVAPDDLVRAYIVLLATAVGLGAFGLFCSSLVKRTQAATVITTFGVIAMTLGSVFILVFWNAMTGLRLGGPDVPDAGLGPIRGRPPEAIGYLNPFLAQTDVICGTQTSFGAYCGIVSVLLDRGTGMVMPSREVVVEPAIDLPAMPGRAPIAGDGPDVVVEMPAFDVVPPDQGFGVRRDAFWPRSVAAWLILAAIFVALSVQLVSPTRRWRFRRGSRTPRSAA